MNKKKFGKTKQAKTIIIMLIKKESQMMGWTQQQRKKKLCLYIDNIWINRRPIMSDRKRQHTVQLYRFGLNKTTEKKQRKKKQKSE